MRDVPTREGYDTSTGQVRKEKKLHMEQRGKTEK